MATIQSVTVMLAQFYLKINGQVENMQITLTGEAMYVTIATSYSWIRGSS
jgi:hypothetical protein